MQEIRHVYTRDKKDFLVLPGADCDGEIWLTPKEARQLASDLLESVVRVENEAKTGRSQEQKAP